MKHVMGKYGYSTEEMQGRLSGCIRIRLDCSRQILSYTGSKAGFRQLEQVIAVGHLCALSVITPTSVMFGCCRCIAACKLSVSLFTVIILEMLSEH